MNTELTNVLNQIKQDKDENLTPQNIKKDVQVLGITGTYDPKPKLQSKTANLSTEENQVIGYDSGYDGLSTVTIPKVTASIDNKITPENIKKDVNILGVTGTYGFKSEVKRASASAQTNVEVKPSEGIDFLDKVIIEKVDKYIDSNIKEGNIKQGVSILGVTGNYAGDYTIQDLREYNMSGYTATILPSSGFDAVKKIVVNHTGISTKTTDAQTATDTIITPSSGIAMNTVFITNVSPNIIRHGYNMFGVAGTYVGDPDLLQEKSVTPRNYVQNIIPDQEYYALSKVVVNAVNSSVDPNIRPAYIREGVNILGTIGTCVPAISVTKRVDPEISTRTYYPNYEQGNATGFSSFTVNGVTANIDNHITAENIKLGVNILGVTGNYAGDLNLQEKSVYPTSNIQNVVPDENYDALSKVVVGAVSTESLTITPSKNPLDYIPATGNFFNSVHVNGVNAEVDSNIQPENIKKNMSILGVTGTYAGDTSEYFGSINASGMATETGTWVSSILSIPDTIAVSGSNGDNLFRGYFGRNIPQVDTGSLTTASNIFRNCVGIRELPNLDYANFTTADNMFHNCANLREVSINNMVKAYTMNNMFTNCTNLTSINLDFSSATPSSFNLMGIFDNCTRLSEVNLDFNNKMCAVDYMFGNTGITSFSGDNISLNWRANGMFYNCKNLVSVTNLKTGQLPFRPYFENMFANSTVSSVDLTIDTDPLATTINGINCQNMFLNANSLDSVNMVINIPKISRNAADSSWYSLNFSNMFRSSTISECNIIANINMATSNYRNSISVNVFNMFYGCASTLRKIPKQFLGYVTAWPSLFMQFNLIDDISDICFTPPESATRRNDYSASLYGTFQYCRNIGHVSNWTGGYSDKIVSLTLGSTFANSGIKSFNMGNGIYINSDLDSSFRNCYSLKAVSLNTGDWVTLSNSFNRCTNLSFVRFNTTFNYYRVQAVNFTNAFNYTPNNVYIFYEHFTGTPTGLNFRTNQHTLDEVRNITVVNMPNKLSYNVGESFDPTGMIINAQNLLDATYNIDSELVEETLGEEYTLSTYSIDKTTLSAGDTSVNVYVTNPLNNTKVEIPITVSE